MNFYVLYPEVSGGLGPRTVLDKSVQPPAVLSLHYEFEGWDGDDLITSFPVLLASERLAKAIQSENFTACTFGAAQITKSKQFQLFQPEIQLPVFLWMKILGSGGKDDIGLSPHGRLMLSERALNLFKSFSLNHCDIRSANEDPDPKQRLQELLKKARETVQRDFPRKAKT